MLFRSVPWGGWKESGIGRTHGQSGLEEMTHTKLINWDLIRAKRNLFWYPFDEQTYERIKLALDFSFPKNPQDLLLNGYKLGTYAYKKMFSKW